MDFLVTAVTGLFVCQNIALKYLIMKIFVLYFSIFNICNIFFSL